MQQINALGAVEHLGRTEIRLFEYSPEKRVEVQRKMLAQSRWANAPGQPPPRLPRYGPLADLEAFVQSHSPSDHVLWEVASGWPFLSLHGNNECGSFPAPEWFARVFGFEYGWMCRLPFIPVLPGFIGNVALFSLPFLVVRATRALVRRRRTRRRGHCPICNYDLCHDLTAGCPECGWNRTPAASAARTV